MNRFDFTPYRRSTVGFDRLFDLLESQARSTGTGDNYPPFNIERRGDDAYRVTLAVAGFTSDQLAAAVREALLGLCAGGAQHPVAVRPLEAAVLEAPHRDATGTEPPGRRAGTSLCGSREECPRSGRSPENRSTRYP